MEYIEYNLITKEKRIWHKLESSFVLKFYHQKLLILKLFNNIVTSLKVILSSYQSNIIIKI